MDVSAETLGCSWLVTRAGTTVRSEKRIPVHGACGKRQGEVQAGPAGQVLDLAADFRGHEEAGPAGRHAGVWRADPPVGQPITGWP